LRSSDFKLHAFNKSKILANEIIVNNRDRLSHKFGNEKARVQVNDIFR